MSSVLFNLLNPQFYATKYVEKNASKNSNNTPRILQSQTVATLPPVQGASSTGVISGLAQYAEDGTPFTFGAHINTLV